jgi:molecular chaperone GrpE
MKHKKEKPDVVAPKQQPAEEKSAEETLDQHHQYQEIIAELESRLAESNEKFLRLFSEFDNYRKRTTKERIELSKTATADIIIAMLPVLDDMERACRLGDSKPEADPVFEGFVLILNKFKSIMRQKGVEEIPAVGEDFNTDFHEAITHIAAEDDEQKGKVMEEIQKGYLLHGKVIRFSKVIVAN